MDNLVVSDPLAGVRTAISVTADMDVASLVLTEQTQWLRNMGSMLMGVQRIDDFAQASEGKILYSVWKRWEDIDNQAKTSWEGDFYNWANAFTKKRPNREPAKITVDNKIAVYRDWEGEKVIPCPESVYIHNRNEVGIAVNEKLENAWVEVKFDLEGIDYSKKLVARGAARDGLMTPEAWSVMADPFSTVEELKSEIRCARENKDGIDGTVKQEVISRNGLEFRFFRQNDLLYVGMGGTVLAFARLLSENNDSPLVKRAMSHMLGAIGVDTSPLEDAIDIDMPIVQVVDDGVLISRGCERIGHFSKQEALVIMGTIEEWLKGNNEDF